MKKKIQEWEETQEEEPQEEAPVEKKINPQSKGEKYRR